MCPVCESTSLLVHSTTESEDQINFYCSKCKTKFPIIERIPLFVDTIMQEEIPKKWDVSKEYEEYTLEPTTQVKKLFNEKSKDTTIALDAGCGSGAYTLFFNSKEIICLDLVPFFLKKLLKEYNGNSKLHVMIADVIRLPFKDKCMDIVFCSSVIENLNNEQMNVVANFSNISKVVLVDVPNDSNKLVLIFRTIFEKIGFYQRRIENASDEKLHQFSKSSVSDLINMCMDA